MKLRTRTAPRFPIFKSFSARLVSTLFDDLDVYSLLKETLILMGNVIGRTLKDFAFGVAPFFVGD
jgi:hypothetical protein